MLNLIRPEPRLDIREMIVQRHSTDAVHSSDLRPGPEDIEELYAVHETLATPNPTLVAVVDDVLTTGAHFRAAQTVLAPHFPSLTIVGLFIARRVPDTSDFEDIET